MAKEESTPQSRRYGGPKEAADKASVEDKSQETRDDKQPKPEPVVDVADRPEMHKRHKAERHEMAKRHEKEHRDLHGQHRDAMRAMHSRQEGEMTAMNNRQDAEMDSSEGGAAAPIEPTPDVDSAAE